MLTNMKLTKNIISRDEAEAMCPDYVAFVEGNHDHMDAICKPFWWDYDKTDSHGYPTHVVKKGQKAITFFEGQYVQVKISATTRSNHETDGPGVRVSNGEASWRVDGDKYCWLLTNGADEARAVVDKALSKETTC